MARHFLPLYALPMYRYVAYLHAATTHLATTGVLATFRFERFTLLHICAFSIARLPVAFAMPATRLRGASFCHSACRSTTISLYSMPLPGALTSRLYQAPLPLRAARCTSCSYLATPARAIYQQQGPPRRARLPFGGGGGHGETITSGLTTYSPPHPAGCFTQNCDVGSRQPLRYSVTPAASLLKA